LQQKQLIENIKKKKIYLFMKKNLKKLGYKELYAARNVNQVLAGV
jgi:rRNA processing protein Krr1/Pno1